MNKKQRYEKGINKGKVSQSITKKHFFGDNFLKIFMNPSGKTYYNILSFST